jgi:non-ribosomal peptide synthetase component F
MDSTSSSSGEPVHPADLDLYRQRCSSECLFINGLGPTESTVALQYFLNHRPCVGLVARYSRLLAPPRLPWARFRPDPTDRSRRMYYTGDLGRLLPDGSIEFAERRDQQLKIRGHRVECGEVDTVLRRHASVAEALVVARTRSSNDMVLVARGK